MAKVLIVRLDGVGDALVCTPLIAALRTAGHTLGIALSAGNSEIFAPEIFAHRHVLERIPWPRHGSTPESARTARAGIAAARYDVALVVSEEPEAYQLARSIPRRIGFTTGRAKPLKSLWVRTQLTAAVGRGASVGAERAHEAEVVFRLGHRAGLSDETAPTRDLTRLRPLVLGTAHADAASNAGAPVVVQLGPKWAAIGVDVRSARGIVAALAARGAVLVCSAAEQAAARELAPDSPLEVCADIAHWKERIAGARAVVTPDTGAAHLAGMLGIGVVDVFADAAADEQIARWHPWASPYVALVARELRDGTGIARIERALDAL